RRLAQPERDARRLALGVLHSDLARFHPQDAVAGIAQLEHVAGHALDREVLVDRADEARLRLQHDRIVAGFGDRAAGHGRHPARALAPAQATVHGVAVHPAGTRAATVAEPA